MIAEGAPRQCAQVVQGSSAASPSYTWAGAAHAQLLRQLQGWPSRGSSTCPHRQNPAAAARAASAPAPQTDGRSAGRPACRPRRPCPATASRVLQLAVGGLAQQVGMVSPRLRVDFAGVDVDADARVVPPRLGLQVHQVAQPAGPLVVVAPVVGVRAVMPLGAEPLMTTCCPSPSVANAAFFTWSRMRRNGCCAPLAKFIAICSPTVVRTYSEP